MEECLLALQAEFQSVFFQQHRLEGDILGTSVQHSSLSSPQAALRAAAGKSNYRLGSPWGITESISRRPACRWQLFALGTGEPQCRESKNKVSCPADVGLRHVKITLLSDNTSVVHHCSSFASNPVGKRTCPFLWVFRIVCLRHFSVSVGLKIAEEVNILDLWCGISESSGCSCALPALMDSRTEEIPPSCQKHMVREIVPLFF